MQILDLIQSIPGVLLAVILPGFGIATAVVPRWRWWERLAAAPGLSAGFFGVLGLALHLVGLPFEPLSVLPVTGLVLGAAVLRRRRAVVARSHVPAWVLAPALAAGLATAAAFVWGLHSQVLPPDWDTAAHGALTTLIARTHDVLPLIPIPLEGTSFARSRPGFEAMAAVISWLGGPSPAASMAPAVTAVLLLLPASLSMLALEVGGSMALAAIVPLVSVGMAFPSIQAILGRYPQVVDSTLVVPFLIALLRLLRAPKAADNLMFLAAASASIWVVHGIEIVSAMVVGGLLVGGVFLSTLRAAPRATVSRTAAAAASIALGALVVTVLTRLPHVPPPLHTEPSTAFVSTIHYPISPRQTLQALVQVDLASPLALALYAIGCVALIARRRLLWVLGAHLIVLVVYVDTVFTHQFHTLWRQLYPWAESDRVLGLMYWVIPFILGVGVLTVVRTIRRWSASRRAPVAVWGAAAAVTLLALLAGGRIEAGWAAVFGTPQYALSPFGVFTGMADLGSWRLLIVVVAVVVVAAYLFERHRVRLPRKLVLRLGPTASGLTASAATLGFLALLLVGVGERTDQGLYDRAVALRALITPADVAVLTSMSETLPRGSLVLTDNADDGGMWLTALTQLTAIIPNGFENGPLATPLVVAIQNACADPGTAVRALQGVDAVYVGSHRLPTAMYPWSADCIARLPGVQKVASSFWEGSESAAFRVTH